MTKGPREGSPFDRAWYRWRHQVILRGREVPAVHRERSEALDRGYLVLQQTVYEIAEAFRAGEGRDYKSLAAHCRADLETLRQAEGSLPDEVRVGYILFGEATEALLAVIGGGRLDAGAV